MNFEPVLKDFKDTITKLIEENKKMREALIKIRDYEYVENLGHPINIIRDLRAFARDALK